MDSRIDDYDWEEAFKFAYQCDPVLGYNGDKSGFTREDVATIYAVDEGENDGQNWVGVFRLKDGRFASLRAGCDYTGWDCQSGGSANVCDTFERMWQYGLDDYERERLADAKEVYLITKIAKI